MKPHHLLLITAHPDDEVLCAGTLFLLKGKGYRLHQVVLTNGELGQDFRQFDPNITTTRRLEHQQASEYLGFDSTHYFDQPDLQLTYTPKLMFRLLKIIRSTRPDIVIIMHPKDPHPDHRVAYQLGLEAVRWSGSGVRPDLGKPHHTPTLLLLPGMKPVSPHIVLDITTVWSKKMRLLKKHASQASPDLTTQLTTLSQLYSSSVPGSSHAEVFALEPSYPSALTNLL